MLITIHPAQKSLLVSSSSHRFVNIGLLSSRVSDALDFDGELIQLATENVSELDIKVLVLLADGFTTIQ